MGVNSKPAPVRLGRELLHDGAVGEVNDAETQARVGGGFGQRREGRDHGIEERQGDGGADAA